MQQSSDVRVHQDVSKGEELAAVLKHYGLLEYASITDLFKILCPLHEDINASMQIDLVRGTYFCYGCGKHGGAYELVSEIESVSGLKAYIILEKIMKGAIGKNKLDIKYVTRPSPKYLLKQAKLYFYSLQKPSWDLIKGSYMHKRGFDSETLKKADVRINTNSNYGIAMPMMDMGRFKGYVLRATSESANKDRKYLYNMGFSRRDTLVGNYNYSYVIVCEGYMDWLRFVQHRKSNVVAILGWKITDSQAEKLKAYTNKIVSALDNTPTGKKGAEYLKSKGFDVVMFKYPETAKDPGDLDAEDFNKAWLDTIREIKKRKDAKEWLPKKEKV